MTVPCGNATLSCPFRTPATSVTTRTRSGQARRVIRGDGDCGGKFRPIHTPGRAKAFVASQGDCPPGRLARPTRVLETVPPKGLRRATAAIRAADRKYGKPDQRLTINSWPLCR